MKKCGHCGKEYPDEAIVCAFDAKPLAVSPVPPVLKTPPTAPAAEPQTKSQTTPDLEPPIDEPPTAAAKALLLTQQVQDDALVGRCKDSLDAWSNRIPFSPIKNIASETQFISATEHVAYRTAVTTQIEKRWLEEHEKPYRSQSLPSVPTPKSKINLWQINFVKAADFSSHRRTKDLPETRKVYDCSRCAATGKITCSKCSGRGELTCGKCDGRRYVSCSRCCGSGHLRRTKRVPRKVNCPFCRGTGKSMNRSCSSCGGKGTTIRDFDEEYHVPCDQCAAKGEVRCSRCNATGKVTCGQCEGSGELTCPICEGAGRMMSYFSAEQSEEPATNVHQYIPAQLPEFKTKQNPISNLHGVLVHSQDEPNQIRKFHFAGAPSAGILTSAVESCRESHQGQILRQRVLVTACPIIEYHYQHARNAHVIFLNLLHGLVEDLAGPIQIAIGEMDALAQKAFEEKRFEDAYRLNLRSICMVEASAEEKQLREKILEALLNAYANIAMLTWLLASVAWIILRPTAPGQYGNFGAFFGAIPTLAFLFLFTRDNALRFPNAPPRRLFGFLIGLSGFICATPIDINSFNRAHWLDWLPFGLTNLFLLLVGIFRSKERGRRTETENHLQDFPDVKAIEAYVCALDPKDGIVFRSLLAVGLTPFCLLFCLALLSATQAPDTKQEAGVRSNAASTQPAATLASIRKAAELGDAKAQCDLGVMYEKGTNVVKNFAQAADWYHKSALQQFAPAQNFLGQLYFNGLGVNCDPAEAVNWYRKAAGLGLAAAERNIAIAYYNGSGVIQDPVEALKWFRKAAEKGHIEAQYELGLMYDQGQGGPSNAAEAVQWYRKSAEAGSPKAQVSLGFLYHEGRGVNKDEEEAVRWWRKAAEQGFPHAQNCLGVAYQRGRGVELDAAQAVKWYRSAAMSGHPSAQFNLARFYQEGCAVPQDCVEAYKWYQIALSNGSTNAEKASVELALKMTGEQLAEAKKLAHEFLQNK